MADNVPLGMEFMRWQSVPSLTNDTLGRAGAVFLVQKSGLQDFVNKLGAKKPTPEGSVPPVSVPPNLQSDVGFGANPTGSGLGVNPNMDQGGLSAYRPPVTLPTDAIPNPVGGGMPQGAPLPPADMSSISNNLMDVNKILGLRMLGGL